EKVQEVPPLKDPVCVRGAFYERIYREMIARHPPHFNIMVAYTTRAPFRSEVAGKHLHFVSEAQIRDDERTGECIELITFNRCLYGLTIGGVKDAIGQGRHCILPVIYDTAIRRLKSANIHSLVILVKPSSTAHIM
ncbi:hypothetical protein PFISCL1PPCAC_26218, partial [Pristionchus fissidentatus]